MAPAYWILSLRATPASLAKSDAAVKRYVTILLTDPIFDPIFIFPRGGREVHITLSHTTQHATAVAILESA